MDLPSLLTKTLANPMFTGMAGAAIVAGVMVQLRSMPEHAWRVLRSQFTVSLGMHSEERMFHNFAHWLAKQPIGKRARRLNVVEKYNDQKETWEVDLAPGPGSHIFWLGRRPYLIRREVEDSSPGGGKGQANGTRRESFSITTLGRDQAPLRTLVEQINTVHIDTSTVPVFLWTTHMGYQLVERRAKRGMDTVYIPEAQKAQIIGAIQKFMDSREWYAERCIPYRLGLSFEGVPGVGKSTLIFTLASHFDRPVMIINPSDVESDKELQKALNQAGNGFVVIEDIDAAGITKDRADKAKDASGKSLGITFSGLLNAIDGIASRDGRVLFITTNHADMLDPALLRPGRVDHRITIELAGETEATTMFKRFYPDGDVAQFHQDIAPHLPVAPSKLQNLLLAGPRLR